MGLVCLPAMVMFNPSLKAETCTVEEAKNRIMMFCEYNYSQYFIYKSIIFAAIRDNFELGEYDFGLREYDSGKREYYSRSFPEIKDAVIKALINKVEDLDLDYEIYGLRAHDTAFIARAKDYVELLTNLAVMADAYLELGS